MLSLTSAFLLAFNVLGDDPGPWPRILSAVGFQAGGASSPHIYVVRSGMPGAADWYARVEKGAYLILEGESSTAALFGFRRAADDGVRVASVIDEHNPGLPLIWQKAVELPRYSLPAEARVFARERWTGAPLAAGFRKGSGAVFWIAATPGEQGYERFPYIPHALAALGLSPPFRSRRLWAFFDYSYRTRVDLDYFASRWRAAGIAALHVASWHFFEPDAGRDQYLKTLIEACHRQGILVYAWVELPHVSEKFWNDHPEWREKTAILQDAHLDWRKLMNLQNRDCFRAISSGLEAMIGRFAWDGVNLAELYFESLEGAANPARFTPMNADVRAGFRAKFGFDPANNPGSREFLDYRASLAQRMQEEWLAELVRLRKPHPDLDLVLTHVDDRFDTGMKDAIGADAARVLPLLDRQDFTFLIEDPATVWHLGPQRYPEIARRYQPLTKRNDKLAIDINIVDRYQDVYPARQQTGTELFQLVNLAARAFPRVALYFENSILSPDLPLLSAAASVVDRMETIGKKLVVDSPHGVGIAWSGAAIVDGKPWPVQDARTLWLPAGAHAVEASTAAPPALRVLDFNGNLTSAKAYTRGTVELSYQSSSRAIAKLSRPAAKVMIDGYPAAPGVALGDTLLLPRGQHIVQVD
jgi:hypothetical protein